MASPVLQFKRGNAGVAGTVPALRPGEPAISLNNFDFFVGIDTSVANNKFFGSHRYWGREDGSTSLRLKLVDKGGSNAIHLKSPDTLSGITTYTLPTTVGAGDSGKVLSTNANGILSWVDSINEFSIGQIISGFGTFTNNVAFTTDTDNILGIPTTGAVTVAGGVGIAKNLTVGAGLSVAGQSYFIGSVTFYGGTINLGDSNADDINVAGEFVSNLVPNTDDTYNLGTGSKRWKNASFSGIGTFATGLVADGVRLGIGGAGVVDTASGPLYLDSGSGTTIINDNLNVTGNIDVTGNVYIGGTTVSLRAEEVYIQNRDIVLAFTTSITPNDTGANHGGIAIASTEGTPLCDFTADPGINTFPKTYKQLMWFKSGTLGFSTDAFGFNYGLAIGTTSMANGVRLAVGSGITMSDTGISATNFYGTNFYGTNASLTGNLNVSGISTFNGNVTLGDAAGDAITINGTATFTQGLTGTISTATRATTVDTTSTGTNTNYHLVFTDNATSTTGATMRVDAGIYYNPSSNNLFASQFIGDLSAGLIKSASANTVITLTGTNASFANDVNVSGATTVTSLNATGNVTLGDAAGDTITVKGTSTFEQTITGTATTAFRAASVDVVGVATNQNYYITLVDGSGNSKSVGVDAELLYNPNTNTFKVGTGVGITQFSGSVSTGTSTSSVPTSSAVIDYVGTQIGNIDLTLGLNADTGGPSTVNTSQTLTISGTANEVETSVSGQTVTIGLPDAVIVGTSLSAPTIRTGTIQSSNTGATAITISANDVTIADDLTVNGNLYVSGNTTQVNTTSMTVEDRTIELGVVDGSTTSTTTWDLGVLFNYGDAGTARKSAMIWEHGDGRFKFAKILDADSNGTNANTPQLTITGAANYAAIEINALWINDCAGQSQVISCSGSERKLENITIDAGTF